jgi:hypothetical protein
MQSTHWFPRNLPALLVAALLVACGGHEPSSKGGSTSSGSTSGGSTSGGSTSGGSTSGGSTSGGGSASTLTVVTTTLPAGTQGVPYSEALTASGGSGALTWALQSGALPPGLTLTSAGVIQGTPTAEGVSAFVVEVSDGTQTASANLSLTVVRVIGPPISLGTWTDLSSPRLPDPVAAMATATVRRPGAASDSVYLFGGFTHQGPTGAIRRYDPALGTVTTLAATLVPRGYLEAAVVGTTVYLLGGSDTGQVYADCWAFDAATETLSRRADMPGARDALAAAAVGDEVYVFGGAQVDWINFSAVPTTSVWQYSTVFDRWTVLPLTLPQPTQWAEAMTWNGRVFVIGGGNFEVDLLMSTQLTVANHASVYEFDPSLGTLTPKAPLPAGTKGMVGGVLGNRLYVCSGDRTVGVHNNAAPWCQVVTDTYSYDPLTNTWATHTAFETDVPGVGVFGGRAFAGAAVADNKLHLFGGYTLPSAGMTVPPCPTQQGVVEGIAEFVP